MRTLLISALLTATLFTTGCARQDVASSTPCPDAGPFVKKADNLNGTVFYDSTRKSYGVQAATSMDSADMGITCNLPAAYQREGLRVRFTGTYYTAVQPVSQPAGYNTYYLTITSISQQTAAK